MIFQFYQSYFILFSSVQRGLREAQITTHQISYIEAIRLHITITRNKTRKIYKKKKDETNIHKHKHTRTHTHTHSLSLSLSLSLSQKKINSQLSFSILSYIHLQNYTSMNVYFFTITYIYIFLINYLIYLSLFI